MSKIRFVLRIDQKDKDGLCRIEALYQISGQKVRIQTHKKILPEFWEASKKEQRVVFLNKKEIKAILPGVNPDVIPTEAEINEINTEIGAIRKKIGTIETIFENDKIIYTPQLVKSTFEDSREVKEMKDDTSKLLFAYMDKYITDHKKKRKPTSLKIYRNVRNRLIEYQKSRNKKVTFASIDYDFFTDFQNFLINRAYKNSTVQKHLSTIKTFLGYAKKQHIAVSDSYKGFKIDKEDLEVIALTNDEFLSLYDADLKGNKRLEQVRDVFCFSCVTGLRYSDMAQLKREHIKASEIKLKVIKTETDLTIPLNKYSRAILAKYTDKINPLPVISNQKMNLYLKGNRGNEKSIKNNGLIVGLCDIVGINDLVEIVRFYGSERVPKTYPKYELIGVHTGRKTFATLSLERGMTVLQTMATTGHKDYRSFQRYVNITEQNKKTAMAKAWDAA